MNTDQETIGSEFLVSPDELLKKVLTSDVVMIPSAAAEALEKVRDEDCSAGEFVEVIERDMGLVSDILSLSNSAAFGAQTKITSIQHAVARIGTKQCENLVVSACMKSLSRSVPASVAWSRDVLWEHVTQTATIARYLSNELRLPLRGEEYAAAMVHDIGRILLAAAAPEVFDTVDRLSFREEGNITQTERDIIGTDHCEIGASFARQNDFPLALVEAIEYHHNPNEQLLVRLVACADRISNHALHCGRDEPFIFDDIGESILSQSKLQIDREQLIAGAFESISRLTMEI